MVSVKLPTLLLEIIWSCLNEFFSIKVVRISKQEVKVLSVL